MEAQLLQKVLEYGLLGIICLVLYSRMQKAEGKVDTEKEGRLEDTKVQAALGVEFKNATLVLGETLQKNTAAIESLREEVSDLKSEVARAEKRS